jgi:hypothetical protein
VPTEANDVCIDNLSDAVTMSGVAAQRILSLHNQGSLIVANSSLTILSVDQSEVGNLDFQSGTISADGILLVEDGHVFSWGGTSPTTLMGRGTTRIQSTNAALFMVGQSDHFLTNHSIENFGGIV